MRTIGGLGLCCLILFSSFSLAQQETSSPGEDAEPDVRVIFDVSGSMKENDPEGLSASALELLAAMLPSEGRAGVWTFGETVDNPLPVAPINSQWRQQALSLSPVLSDYQQFTDIEAAIRDASQSPAEGQRHLVLLTDGMIDLPAGEGDKARLDAESRRRLLEDVVPELAEQNVVIHAIAFSTDADIDLVEQLARMTDGLATLAETPETLLRAFLSISERIFPVDQVPLDEDGSFTVDDGVDSFTALLFHDPDAPPLTLVDPEGRRYTVENPPEGVRWQSESRFDIITIPSPDEGEWRVEGEFGADSRISVDSSLVLRNSGLPTTLYLGFDLAISAWLEREGRELDAASLPDDLQVRAELQNPDGEVQSRVSLEREGARYEGMLPTPELIGNARLVIAASSDTLERQQVQAVNVLPAVGAELDAQRRHVELRAEHPRLDVDNTEPRAELQGDSLEVVPVGEDSWRIELPELDPDVSVPLLLEATIRLDDETRDIRLPRLMLNPDGEITLGEARLDGTGMQAGELEEENVPDTPEEAQPELADRIVSAINALPRQAQSLWREARPGVERVAREHGGDPRLWMLLLFPLLVLMLLVMLWRRMSRRSRRRRLRHMEEPHV